MVSDPLTIGVFGCVGVFGLSSAACWLSRALQPFSSFLLNHSLAISRHKAVRLHKLNDWPGLGLQVALWDCLQRS